MIRKVLIDWDFIEFECSSACLLKAEILEIAFENLMIEYVLQ